MHCFSAQVKSLVLTLVNIFLRQKGRDKRTVTMKKKGDSLFALVLALVSETYMYMLKAQWHYG